MRQLYLATFLSLALGASCESPPANGWIGAQFVRDNETRVVQVRQVREGFPASEAGVEPGDEVVMIDGIYVRGLTAEELKGKIHGANGTSVALTLGRGTRIFHVEIKRSNGPAVAPSAKPQPKQEILTE